MRIHRNVRLTKIHNVFINWLHFSLLPVLSIGTPSIQFMHELKTDDANNVRADDVRCRSQFCMMRYSLFWIFVFSHVAHFSWNTLPKEFFRKNVDATLFSYINITDEFRLFYYRMVKWIHQKYANFCFCLLQFSIFDISTSSLCSESIYIVHFKNFIVLCNVWFAYGA